MRTVLFDISILSTQTRETGIGRYVAELASHLTGAGDLNILFLERASLKGEIVITDDAAAAITRLTDQKRPAMGRWDWAYGLRLGAGRACRSVGADILHLPHSSATPLMATRVRRITTCHDLIPLRFPELYTNWADGCKTGRYLLDRRRFNSADHIVAISQATADDLKTILHVDERKISVIYNGILLDYWMQQAGQDDYEHLSALGISEHKPYLLCSGNVLWHKNHHGMLAALAKAKHQIPDIELVWVGRLNPAKVNALLNKAKRLGVENNVRFTGYVDDTILKALYRRALALLHVSLVEGFGLPIIEAMALGCPVITSDCSSMAEISRGAALLVNPYDHDAIASVIISLAADGTLRSNLIADGLQQVRNFTLERQVNQVLEIYRSI